MYNAFVVIQHFFAYLDFGSQRLTNQTRVLTIHVSMEEAAKTWGMESSIVIVRKITLEYIAKRVSDINKTFVLGSTLAIK